MNNSRKLAALRALAERPGTPAEGEAARRKLAELEAKQPKRPQTPAGVRSFVFERTAMTDAEVNQAIRDLNESLKQWSDRVYDQEFARYGREFGTPKKSTKKR